MKKIFFLLLVLISFKAFSQVDQEMPQSGYTTKKFTARDILRIPSDTTSNKTGIARISNTLYVGNGTYWTAAGTVLDTTSLSNRINLKLNISDTASMLSVYLRKVDTASLSNRINTKLNISDTTGMRAQLIAGSGIGLSGTYPNITVANTGLLTTPTLQQVLTAGSTLTGANTVAGGAYNFSLTDMGITTISQNAKASVSGANGTANVSPLTVTGGAGGATSYSTGTVSGGNAGAINLTGGNGGAITGTPTTGIGGTGGNITLLAGDGGLGTTFGGTGGNVDIQGGNGGGGNAGGSAGYAAIKAGNAGSTGNAAGGNIYMVPGIGNGSGGSGHIFIGLSPSATVRGFTTFGSATAGDSLVNIKNGGLFAERGVRFTGLPTSVGTKAVRIDSSGNLSVTDTSTASGSGTVTSVAKGYGIVADGTITTTGTITADTSILVNKTGAQTLTNKTLTSPVINVTSDATGDMYYRNASGLFTRLPIGTAGQHLVGGTIPAWKDTATGGGGMIYPGAGIPNSTGSAWGTSYTTTGSGTVIPLQTNPSFLGVVKVPDGTSSAPAYSFTSNAATGLLAYNYAGFAGDQMKAVANNTGAGFAVQNNNANGYSGIEYYDNTGAVKVFTGYNNSTGNEFRFNNFSGAGAYTRFLINNTEKFRVNSTGVGVGVTPSAVIHGLGTAEQLRLGYDTSNYMKVTVSNFGSTTLDLVGTSPVLTIGKNTSFTGVIKVADGTSSAPAYSFTSNAATGLLAYNYAGFAGDQMKAVANNTGAGFAVQNNNANGYSGIEYYDNTGAVKVFTGYNNSTGNEFRFNNFSGAGAYTRFLINTTEKLRITTDGITITSGTLTGDASITQTATLNSAGGSGNSFQVTGAGSGGATVSAAKISLLAGYTGAGSSFGIYAQNQSVNSATNEFSSASAANYGEYIATTTGTVSGQAGYASGGNRSYGGFYRAIVSKNSATNIGVGGFGLNGGTSPIQIGGYFALVAATPTYLSAALIANNGSQTDPIFLAQDNGTTTFTIADGGSISTGTASAAVASAQVDITSTTKGLLIPRMTTTQRDAISSPATALQIFSTTDSTNYIYRGTTSGWQATLTGIRGSGTLDFGSIAHHSEEVLTISVTGAAEGDVVSLGIPNASNLANVIFTAWVSATDTVSVKCSNLDQSAAKDPASGTFKVTILKF